MPNPPWPLPRLIEANFAGMALAQRARGVVVDAGEKGVEQELGGRGPVPWLADAAVDEATQLGVLEAAERGGGHAPGDAVVDLHDALALGVGHLPRHHLQHAHAVRVDVHRLRVRLRVQLRRHELRRAQDRVRHVGLVHDRRQPQVPNLHLHARHGQANISVNRSALQTRTKSISNRIGMSSKATAKKAVDATSKLKQATRAKMPREDTRTDQKLWRNKIKVRRLSVHHLCFSFIRKQSLQAHTGIS